MQEKVRFEEDTDLNSMFNRQFSAFLNELSKGKDGVEEALRMRVGLIEFLKNREADDHQLELLLLMARASLFLRELQGEEVFFKAYLDTTIDLFHQWFFESSQVRNTKLLSVEVREYTDYAARCMRKIFWYVIDEHENPDITTEEREELWMKSCRIRANDPELNECALLFHTVIDLFEEHAPAPEEVLEDYMKIRYRR